MSHITEQNTHSLHVASITSAIAFKTYLRTFGLTTLEVSRAANVRYATIWNLEHGIPIKREHAMRVRACSSS